MAINIVAETEMSGEKYFSENLIEYQENFKVSLFLKHITYLQN
jgi:hypothetical protein